MCSQKKITEALEGVEITDRAISFLKNKKNLTKIADKIISDIRKRDDFYIEVLNDNNKKFLHSILGDKGHLKYLEKTLIHEKVSFIEYNENALELKNLQKAYYLFYVKLQEYILQDTSLHRNVKEVLNESFKAFSKMYC